MAEYPQSLNLNPVNNKWLLNHKVSEDRKLELRLGPPGEFLGYDNSTIHGTKRAFQHTAETTTGAKDWSMDTSENQTEKTGDTVNCTPTLWSYGSTPYSAFQRDTENEMPRPSKASFFPNLPISKKLAGMAEDFSHPCSSRMAEIKLLDRKACSSLANADADTTTNNTSNKRRIAYSPVVGWPPIRSFRKNLASSSSSLSKPASESPNEKEDTGRKPENSKTQLFVKINMEGIPIGRKVNLGAFNSYEKLSIAIDELFSGLLAAQRDSSATQNKNKIGKLAKEDAGSLAGTGEYTLIYEDDEGDRMLVGDVPWHMFVVTAKRLHVLKSSELSNLRIGSNEKEKTPLDPTVHI